MAQLSGQYKIATRGLITGSMGVYLVDPQTGIVIAQLAFTNQVPTGSYSKIAADLDDLLSREI